MKRTIGWFTVEGDRVAENRFTGERLSYQMELSRGPERLLTLPKNNDGDRITVFPAGIGSSIAIRGWQLYEYAKDDFRIPIAISVAKQSNAQVCIVDYGFTAEIALGKRVSDEGASLEYGLWRRLEEFVLDAVLLLKLDLSHPQNNYGVVTLGGWVNSSWRKNLVSSLKLSRSPFDFIADNRQSPSSGDILQPSVALTPLNARPPAPWSFYPLPEERSQNETIRDLPENYVPNGLVLDFSLEPRSKWPRLDGLLVPPRLRVSKLTRSQRSSVVDLSPCVYSPEAGRLLYMRSAEPTGNEDRKFIGYDYSATSNWIYADDRLTFGVDFESRERGVFTAHLPSFVSEAVKDQNVARVFDLRKSSVSGVPSDHLTRNFNIDLSVLQHRSVWASIVDGLLIWGGSKARHGRWSTDISLESPLYLWRTMYLFGYWRAGYRCSWLCGDTL